MMVVTQEELPNKVALSLKRQRDNRIIAMQYLYQFLNSDQEWTNFLKTTFELSKYNLNSSFAWKLLKNTGEGKENLIVLISPFLAKKWIFPRIDVVDQAILLLASYELTQTTTPKAIIINEYLEIAKKYTEPGAFKYINKVLDQIERAVDEQTNS